MTLAYLDVIREESQGIISAYKAEPEGRVPWSDRWKVGTVARHVAGTHHVVADIVRDRPNADFSLFATLVTPEKSDPVFPDWFEQGTAEMCRQLDAAPATDACWTWYEGADGNVSFWARRMAHECVIHRWDAQMGAAGTADPIDPFVARDGIDEFLDIFVATGRAQAGSPPGPTVSIAAVDTDDHWTIELPAGGRLVRRVDEPTEAQLTGNASELLLLLWGRLAAIPATISTAGAVSDRALLTQLLPAL